MLNNLQRFDNFIFDMDGTLVNSSDEVLKCLQMACEKNGAQIDYSKFSSNVIGPPLKQIIQSFIVDKDNEELVEKVMTDFREIYDNDENDKSAMYENTYQWLISLKNEGKKLFLATFKPTRPTQKLLRLLKLNFFEAVYTIDMYPQGHITKSQMISEIIEKFGLEKSKTVMIGDAPTDINAAHDAGVQAIGVLWGYGDHREELLKISDFTMGINDLRKLERV